MFKNDLEFMSKITPDDVVLLNELLPLAKEAKEVEELIKSTYVFRIGEDKIELIRDSSNAEYLTHGGTWQARYLHQTYDVFCSAKEIFEYMKADYMIRHGYFSEESEEKRKADNMATIYRYFCRFIAQTMEKARGSDKD